MNKLVIPSILTAIVLVAGMFAVMPIQKASTVHTTIIAALNSITTRAVSVTYNLDAFLGGAKVVVLDTTDIGNINKVHIATVLPISTGSAVCASQAPLGVQVLAGVAGGTGTEALTSIITGTQNTGIQSLNTATGSSCVFHLTFTPTSTTPSRITDIVVSNTGTTPLPDDSSITVTARL